MLYCNLVAFTYMRYNKKILIFLKNNPNPFTIRNLQSYLLEQNLKPNKTTLYRILEKFHSLNLVNKVMLDSGITFYEFSGNAHHHHLICEECKNIQSYSLSKTLEDKILLNASGWQINDHNFEIFGKCPKCLAKKI